jgi:hypothetical protein
VNEKLLWFLIFTDYLLRDEVKGGEIARLLNM